jgi:DNA invertase Pin-like site-specific DNA recombinase
VVSFGTRTPALRFRAIGFCRLSTEEQAQEGRAGLLRQREEIRLCAERWNLEVVRTVEITDVSGTQVLESQEFQELLHSLPDVDGVVIAAIDRLMRPDDFSSFSIYDHFLKQRKLIWTPSSALDVHEDSGFMEALVSGMMAGLDRRRILRNTQTAKEENRKRGRCANAKITLPQGIDFDFKTGQWNWVEPWANRVKTAFEILVTTNRSVLSIAKELGYASDRVLYNQLRNPIWTGYRVYSHKRGEKLPSRNGRQADRKKMRRAEPLRVKLDIEPLVSEEQFAQAQKILGQRRKSWLSARSEESRFEASGLLYCRCGERMYSKGSGRCGRQKALDIYYCRSQHKGGAGCGAPKLSREVTDYSLNSLISEIFLDDIILGSLIEQALAPWERPSIDEKVAKAAMELERLRAEKRQLLSLTLKGLFSEREVATEARRIDAETRSWGALVSQDQQERALRSTASIRETALLIASVFAEYQFLNLTDRKRLTRQFVKRIEVVDRRFTAVTLSLPALDAKIRSRMEEASNFGGIREVTLGLPEPDLRTPPKVLNSLGIPNKPIIEPQTFARITQGILVLTVFRHTSANQRGEADLSGAIAKHVSRSNIGPYYLLLCGGHIPKHEKSNRVFSIRAVR